MKKTLMITGSSGFIGSNFIKKYDEEYNIITVDLLVRRPEEIDFNGVDVILHLAALVHQMKGAPREKYFEINTELTRQMAVAAKNKGVKHFIFYSTVAVYGTHGSINKELIFTKESEVNPKTSYAESKWEAEEILRSLQDENFNVSILRPPMVYGKNCPGNMRKLEKIVQISPILPFGNNKCKRTLIHIDNLLNETRNVINNKKIGIIIPKDENDMSLKDIVNFILEEKQKKRINFKMPISIIKLLRLIDENSIDSLYGGLIFK